MSLAILGGIAALLIWLYLLCARGRFWRLDIFQADSTPAVHSRIVAIIPARNEADVIARAVRSLLNQEHLRIQLIVVDDSSSDGTAEAVSHAAASGRVEVITGKPLPPGWSGKLWALQQGIAAAEKYSSDFLLFTDADIEHEPNLVAALVTHAEHDHLDLASLMVKLHCRTLPEKLLIPPFVFFFFKLYPPLWIAKSKKKTAGAAGGCILIRPAALQKAGGMESICSAIIDDCTLAARVKASGGRIWLAPTDAAHSMRPYRTFTEISRMISRTAFNQLNHSWLMLLISIIGLTITYLAPVFVLFSASEAARILGALACVLMITAYLPTLRYYRLNPLWSLTLPFAAVFYMAATIRSAINYWSGKGGQWKGRSQDQISSQS